MATAKALEANREAEVAKNAVSKIVGNIVSAELNGVEFKFNAEDLNNAKRHYGMYRTDKREYWRNIFYLVIAFLVFFASTELQSNFENALILELFLSFYVPFIWYWEQWEKSKQYYINEMVGDVSQFSLSEAKKIKDTLMRGMFGARESYINYLAVLCVGIVSYGLIAASYYELAMGNEQLAKNLAMANIVTLVASRFFCKFYKEK